MEELTILIVEDEEELLDIYGEYAWKVFDRVISTETYKNAQDIIEKQKIDCILLDNRLPDGRGIDLVKYINQKKGLNIPVIMITGYADKELAIESVNTGIFYFLEKPVSRNEILTTLLKCRTYIRKESEHQQLEIQYILTEVAIDQLKERYKISEREIDIIREAIQLHKNTVIADNLHISPGTVKRHLHNIFEKLEVSSREDLQEFIQNLNTSQSSE